ncbi:MAG: ATP-binding protein [Zoogloeaceae bacterium]|jgi:predicted AAA+ superfamily ATPase|nr:ATP-binding protein [Zoogloeaceae bacterium]
MNPIQTIPREGETRRILEGLPDWPVTAVLGSRQCGKTWLTRPLASVPENYFDLHNFVDRARLEESNFRVLDGLEGVIVIDEAQEMPDLFMKLRVLADRTDSDVRFVVTGSASPALYRHAAESLAGRVRLLPLSGFSLLETGQAQWERLWVRGGYPLAFLRQTENASLEWRQQYISQFLGKDLPALAETKLSLEQLRRFFMLLAHHHGTHWNHSEVAATLGVSYKTVQRHVDIFKGAFIVRELPPWFANLGKRLRKAPKLYLRDSGLLHALLSIKNRSDLFYSPKMGASWEGFCLEQLVSVLHLREEELFCWSVSSGAEVDLVIARDAPIGIEMKAADAPRCTASMRSAKATLGLKKLFVLYPGDKDYPLDDDIEAVGIANLEKLVAVMTE